MYGDTYDSQFQGIWSVEKNREPKKLWHPQPSTLHPCPRGLGAYIIGADLQVLRGKSL